MISHKPARSERSRTASSPARSVWRSGATPGVAAAQPTSTAPATVTARKAARVPTIPASAPSTGPRSAPKTAAPIAVPSSAPRRSRGVEAITQARPPAHEKELPMP